MPNKDSDLNADRMLEAALGGMTPHQALIQASLADAADTSGRAAAAAKNRERALRLLEAIEQSMD
jgi:hypothetical protein